MTMLDDAPDLVTWECDQCSYFEIEDEPDVVAEAVAEHLAMHAAKNGGARASEPPAIRQQSTAQAVDTAPPVDDAARDVGDRKYWHRERVIHALTAWAESHGGKGPASTDWSKSTDEHPSHTQVKHVFGTWNAAIVEAGIKPRGGGRQPGSARKASVAAPKPPPKSASGEIDLVAAAKYVQGCRDEIRSLEGKLAATRANLIEAEQVVRDAIG